MKRIITSFKNANKDVLKEISILYPKGVEEDDLIRFPTANGGSIRALEIEFEDALYLVKMEDQNYYKKYMSKDEDDEDEEDDDNDDSKEEFDDDEFDGSDENDDSSDDEDDD